MKVTNALVTYTDLSTMGLIAKGSPATGTRIATKQFVIDNYYVDENASPFVTYTALRCPPYQTIIAGSPVSLSATSGCAGGENTGTVLANGFSGGTESFEYITISSISSADALTKLDNPATRTFLGGATEYTFTGLGNATYYVAIMDSGGNKGFNSAVVSCTFATFSLTYSASSGSTACSDYPNPINRNFYYAAAGSTLTTGTILYTTSALTTPVANGFYSNGVDYWNTAASAGNLQNQTSCTPPTTTTTTTVAPPPTTTTTTTPSPPPTTTTTTTAIPIECYGYEVNADDGTGDRNTYPYTYITCGGVSISANVTNLQPREICAARGSVDSTSPFVTITEIGPCLR